MKVYSILVLLLTSYDCISQTWQPVGTPAFSTPIVWAQLTAFALDTAGLPYVAYPDSALGGKATVMRFDGSSWIVVGNPGFTSTSFNYVSLEIDGQNTPYMAIMEQSTAGLATVMKFDGTNWVYVGPQGFSLGQANGVDLAIDSHDSLWIVYNDMTFSQRDVVQKFNGTNWINVGTPGFTPAAAHSNQIAINNLDEPYIIFQDASSSHYFNPTAMKYDNFNWNIVGGNSVSNVIVQFPNIVFDFSKVYPWVCYNIGGGTLEPKVFTFNDSGWIAVGPNSPIVGKYMNGIAISSNGTPNVVSEDPNNNFKAVVSEFNGTSWVIKGNSGFSHGYAMLPHILIDKHDNIYVQYYDRSDSNKITVMKYDVSSSVKTLTEENISVYPNPAKDYLIIQLPSSDEIFSIKISDILGIECQNNMMNVNSMKVDISQLNPGIYFYEIIIRNSNHGPHLVNGKFLKL